MASEMDTIYYVRIDGGRVPGRHNFPTLDRAVRFVREMKATGVNLEVHRVVTVVTVTDRVVDIGDPDPVFDRPSIAHNA